MNSRRGSTSSPISILALALAACGLTQASERGSPTDKQHELLANLRIVIENTHQDVLMGLDPNQLSLEDGALVLRVGNDRAGDAFNLCDVIFASSGGYGELTPTRILIDDRLAAEGLVNNDGEGDCFHR